MEPVIAPVVIEPPSVFLLQTTTPNISGNTNEALFDYIRQLEQALAMCNQDKKSIEEWFRRSQKTITK